MKTTMQGRDLETLLKVIKYLEKKVKETKKHNGYCEVELEMKNTGITQVPYPLSSDGWARHVDLGGRDIKIDISFPNSITMLSVLTKLDKENG